MLSLYYICFLSKAAHSPPCPRLDLSWRASSSSEPSFQNLPQASDQALCLQNKPGHSRSKAHVPRTPKPRQKTGLGSQLCNEHKSVRKAENTWALSSPPVYKGRSRAPRLRLQPEDSEAQRVPDEPQWTQGSRIRKLPLAARHAFHKSRGTNCILPLLSLGLVPKGSLCRAGRGKPTTPRNKGLGDSPGLGLVPLSLAAGSSLKIPTKPCPLRLCPKCSSV